MKSAMTYAAFGLFLVTTILGAATPARAAVLKNLVNQPLLSTQRAVAWGQGQYGHTSGE